jgi:amino-acid N-acetyltransferase
MSHLELDEKSPPTSAKPAECSASAGVRRADAVRRANAVRRATLADVEDMHRLINHFAGQQLMLAKSRNQLYQNIRDFAVAEKVISTATGAQRVFAGCGALHVIWVDLGEIRSLAVDERFQGNGTGRLIVHELLREAADLKLPRVFALTYQRAFFERLGFTEVDKATMPQKIWGECMNCPKFPNCDEIAMVLDLPPAQNTGATSSDLDALLVPTAPRGCTIPEEDDALGVEE